MKLTEDKLKQMIAEELGRLTEEEPEEPAADAAAPEAAGDEKAKVNSTSMLKQELVDLSRNITKIPGLDPNELNLISGMIGTLIKISSTKSAASVLKRVYDVLQRNLK